MKIYAQRYGKGLPAKLPTAKPLTCDKKLTLPAGMAGSPFDRLVGLK